MTPLVGRKLWFAPRRWGGWGWSPVSVEGWVVTIAAVVVILVFAIGGHAAAPGVVVAAVLVVICAAKGTSPGSERAWREWKRSTGEEPDT
jgi:hypothetical protein